jgi:threonine/homoserine/homoserine lactone efflux protein
MFESIITISVAAFLSGFLFSMPIVGPISITVTSNALKGRLRYCNLVAIGASVADFLYVFIAVYGVTKLYSLYMPAMPYIFALGSVFFFFLGYKIFKTKIDIEHLEDKSHLSEKIIKKEKGGFLTGLMISFLNPTLFLGVLTSAFFVISLIASLGLNTGGLSGRMDNHIKEVSTITGNDIENTQVQAPDRLDNFQILKNKNTRQDLTIYTANFHFFISVCYGLFLSLGAITWFFIMAFLIVRYRKRINKKVISVFIKSLGVILCLIAIYFGSQAVKMLFNL